MKEDNKYADLRTRRPSGNGAPAWLAAMLVEQWADHAFPIPPEIKNEQCVKCNAVTSHTVQSYCSGVAHKCNICGVLKFGN